MPALKSGIRSVNWDESERPGNWDDMTIAQREGFYRKNFAKRNPEKVKLWAKRTRDNPENRDRKRLKAAEYRKLNREKLREKNKAYYLRKKPERSKIVAEKIRSRKISDPAYKITCLLRNRLYLALKNQGAIKSKKTLALIGCDTDTLKAHIESRFRDGMNWGNHGFFGWHIDHIRPCASFDLTDPAQQAECCNYKNLQPLWWHENLSKNDEYKERGQAVA